MKKRIKLLFIAFFAISSAIIFSTNCSSDEESLKATIPSVSTDEVYNITYTTTEVRGSIITNGNSPILNCGFCWSKNPTPTISDNINKDAVQSGSFRNNMTNLEEGATYYVRAYATNSLGTSYGAEKTFETALSCQTMVARRQGYQVWAGDTPYFQESNHYDYFYSIDKYGYKLIGESTTTQTFNTGSYKYYVIVSKYWNCLDAIQFNDGSYYGQKGTQYTGLTQTAQITGAPDGIYGKFGDKAICPPGNSTYNAFITDDLTISSRGGGLKVIVGTGCQ